MIICITICCFDYSLSFSFSPSLFSISPISVDSPNVPRSLHNRTPIRGILKLTYTDPFSTSPRVNANVTIAHVSGAFIGVSTNVPALCLETLKIIEVLVPMFRV